MQCVEETSFILSIERQVFSVEPLPIDSLCTLTGFQCALSSEPSVTREQVSRLTTALVVDASQQGYLGS